MFLKNQHTTPYLSECVSLETSSTFRRHLRIQAGTLSLLVSIIN